MHALVALHGQPGWVAALTPLSVDGMIVAASTTLLAESRFGGRGGVLPWALLVIGSVASLAANVAVAEPTAIGRVIAAWPSFALTGSRLHLRMRVGLKLAVVRTGAWRGGMCAGAPGNGRWTTARPRFARVRMLGRGIGPRLAGGHSICASADGRRLSERADLGLGSKSFGPCLALAVVELARRDDLGRSARSRHRYDLRKTLGGEGRCHRTSPKQVYKNARKTDI